MLYVSGGVRERRCCEAAALALSTDRCVRDSARRVASIGAPALQCVSEAKVRLLRLKGLAQEEFKLPVPGLPPVLVSARAPGFESLCVVRAGPCGRSRRHRLRAAEESGPDRVQ